MKFLSTLIVTLFFSSPTFSQNISDREKECRAQGFIVLYSWYKLDACLKYQTINIETIKEAKNNIFKAYPKLQETVDANSEFSQNAKEAATTWSPYTVEDNQNPEILKIMCKTNLDFLNIVTTREDWKLALSCMR
ncbi:hypothetical protein HA050_09100 [Iodobacter sp. HSC-16F04]|uniref:DUF1311 domain-containing protein n=1 Tax=Iodobacter violaceini TaxID=3044271 RepID=A0ABX0KV03_9NEIS|nr:hypothetical protein [Iodobacter violacea]NHQ86272.1 hypothetical protein [Iodobacter violacea]